MEKVIQYKPTDENRAYLLRKQFERNKKGSYLGLNRIVDILITEMRKKSDVKNR